MSSQRFKENLFASLTTENAVCQFIFWQTTRTVRRVSLLQHQCRSKLVKCYLLFIYPSLFGKEV